MSRYLPKVHWPIAMVLIGATAISLLALTYAVGRRQGPAYKVATHYVPRGGARALTGFGGYLRGQINADGTACFWVGNDPSERTALIWPNGYEARANPVLSIYDENGHVLGSVGQLVEFDGSTAPPEDIVAQARTGGILGCPPMPRVEWVAPPA